MKFFTITEIINSIIMAILLGGVFGCIYKSAKSIFFALAKLLVLVPRELFNMLNKTENRPKKRMAAIYDNIIDALFFSLFGLNVILLFYITLDGVFRIYILFISIVSFLFVSKTVGSSFKRVFDFLFNKIYTALEKGVRLLLKPICFVLKYIFILKECIKCKILDFNSRRISSKKVKEFKKIFKKYKFS